MTCHFFFSPLPLEAHLDAPHICAYCIPIMRQNVVNGAEENLCFLHACRCGPTEHRPREPPIRVTLDDGSGAASAKRPNERGRPTVTRFVHLGDLYGD